MKVDYKTSIPNNVNLSDDKKLQRALERWLPDYADWWMEVGPAGFQQSDVYLRTAISVERGGWAHFDYVKMPEYRWGIFMTPLEEERKIQYGDFIGQKVWQDVPGEYRKELKRLIVTQGDTEPASVEQQSLLGRMSPSLYDMRNLFQVNVEEGRHLWAMVFLLHRHFGRDGREEAHDLLTRRSAHSDHPRMLDTFNEPVLNWLDFFCFAMFTDRDGKYQLAALAESAFDPLSRTCQFMLTEEAHHLFVGETGLARIIRRTAQLMKEAPGGDVRKLAGIPLETIQKTFNYWFSSCLDLFGGEDSSNAASYFSSALKGRFNETNRKKHPNASGLDAFYDYTIIDDKGHEISREIPMRRAMNAILRDDYIADCTRALVKWNKVLEEEGAEQRLALPSEKFNRKIGVFANMCFTPDGKYRVSEKDFERRCKEEWFPTEEEKNYITSVMTPVTEPGQFANWISPPAKGIDGRPIEFEYVKIH